MMGKREVHYRNILVFYSCKYHNLVGISRQGLDIFHRKGTSLDRCRAQGYDGARTMSGACKGVLKTILEKQPKTSYIHCVTHNLNLVFTKVLVLYKKRLYSLLHYKSCTVSLVTVLKDGFY